MPQFLGIALAFVLLTQLLLDRLHLLAQIIFALTLLDAVLHFRLNFVSQLLDFELLGQMLINFFQAHSNISCLEGVLFVGGRERRQ